MNFDEYIDRREYPTLKWSRSFLSEHFGNAEAIPMSVADMDFKSPPAVIQHLQKRVSHGIFGYEYRPDSYFDALSLWYEKRHGWKINREHITPSPSILSSLSILVDQHSNEGDGVIIQPPVFFEFHIVIRKNHRRVVNNPLKLLNGKYRIDFEDLKKKASDPANKVLILCSPHNPIGRVWTMAELKQVAEICKRNNVFVIADEIHADFTLPPHRFFPYLKVADGENAASCIAPTKTFNIPGVTDALCIIPNEKYRKRFLEFTGRYHINKVNVFALAATEAAYREGEGWLNELLAYLQENVDFVRKYLHQNDIGVSLIEPEGTFLAWLDFRDLGLDVKMLEKFLAQEAQIALAPGYWFGREGAGFARMTIACPRRTIVKALNNLKLAASKLPGKPSG